jgi:hypothetical protein
MISMSSIAHRLLRSMMIVAVLLVALFSLVSLLDQFAIDDENPSRRPLLCSRPDALREPINCRTDDDDDDPDSTAAELACKLRPASNSDRSAPLVNCEIFVMMHETIVLDDADKSAAADLASSHRDLGLASKLAILKITNYHLGAFDFLLLDPPPSRFDSSSPSSSAALPDVSLLGYRIQREHVQCQRLARVAAPRRRAVWLDARRRCSSTANTSSNYYHIIMDDMIAIWWTLVHHHPARRRPRRTRRATLQIVCCSTTTPTVRHRHRRHVRRAHQPANFDASPPPRPRRARLHAPRRGRRRRALLRRARPPLHLRRAAQPVSQAPPPRRLPRRSTPPPAPAPARRRSRSVDADAPCASRCSFAAASASCSTRPT